MTKLLLTRHGHVEGIKPKIFRGRAELALTELGRHLQRPATLRRHWRGDRRDVRRTGEPARG